MAVKKDFARSFEFSAKACELADPDGCAFLAGHYEGGDGVGKDLDKARTYFQKACDAGSGTACRSLKRLK